MRSAEFSQAVAAATSTTEKQVNAIFKAAAEIIKAQLHAGHTVKIHMIGQAYVVSYPARIHVNNVTKDRSILLATKKARLAFAGHVQNHIKPRGI